MLDIQIAALRHLTEPGHPQRLQCLNDLTAQYAFGINVPRETFINIVTTYLKTNRRGFCSEGISRFRKAIGLQEELKVHIASGGWKVESGPAPYNGAGRAIYISVPTSSASSDSERRPYFTADSNFAKALREALDEG